MKKHFLLAFVLSVCTIMVVSARKKESSPPEKPATVQSVATHNLDYLPGFSFAVVDHQIVEIQGGALYHLETVIVPHPGYKPDVTAKARAPTTLKDHLLPDLRAKD